MKTKEELVKLLKSELFGIKFPSTLKVMAWELQNNGESVDDNSYTKESIKNSFTAIVNKQLKFLKVENADTDTIKNSIHALYGEFQDLFTQIFHKE
jgi:hypothetical protein